ncbi:hypothetical protein L208DRAFT_1515702 [Tricholoma matsutake]|nr:hypothetical protein L208DRAFT_1515702 [Tricholoma matsutake 945]
MDILQNFVGHPALLRCMEDIIKDNVKYCKSMQLADPGSIVQTGVSAGAQSKPMIGWVKNIKSKKLADESVDHLNERTAHAFSLLWMFIHRRLLNELPDDIVTWLAETGIYWMNKKIVEGFEKNSVKGELELEIGEESFSFEWAELTPPSGAMAANYSRHLPPVNQPHKFATAWTISRTLREDQGGHFYNCKYSIRAKGGNDTIVAWDPSHFHGTSLQDYLPKTDAISQYNQVGLAIVTPNWIPGLWKKYAKEQAALDKMLDSIVSDDEEEGDKRSDSDGGL